MKDFLLRNKAFIGVVLGTIGLLLGGVFLFSRGGGSTNTSKVSDTILIPSGSYKFTSENAPVTLVEFGDYQCPACGTYHPLVKQLLADFSGKLNFVFRNFPLPQHGNAPISSYAVEAAGLQGKFWQMHDKIYETQSEWSNSADAKTIFVGYAKGLGLDTDKFKVDIDSQKIKDKVTRDVGDGNLIKIDSTPTFFVNGEKAQLPGSYDQFKKMIQDAIDSKPQAQSTGSQAYHIHFDLSVFQNAKTVDFSQAKYQESKTNVLDENIHFHDGNGKVVHVHKQGIPLKELFNSLKISLPANVLAYVNGKKLDNILDYVPQDLDQILIGSSNLGAVSKDACIYSLKCLERGTPPPENCVGGLGTGCTD